MWNGQKIIRRKSCPFGKKAVTLALIQRNHSDIGLHGNQVQITV